MNTPTYLDDLPRRRALVLHAIALGATDARVIGLRIDTAGHLSEVRVRAADPWSAMRAHVETRGDLDTGGAAGAEALDTDLVMWFDLDGAEHARRNPTASVVAAMFGRPGPVFGPVVFTGCTPPPAGHRLGEVGKVCDVSVAATLLLAGTARACDPQTPVVDRAAEFARLDVDIVPAPRASADRPGPASTGSALVAALPDDSAGRDDEVEVSYDAQAHTVTVDGDLPRCAECDQHTSTGHPEHQPKVLAERDTRPR